MTRRVSNAPPLPARKRRRAPAGTLTKVTFTLHPETVAALRDAVISGQASTASAFVEEAVRERLNRSRRTELYSAYAEAAADPEFMRDMASTTKAFAAADADGLRGRRR